MTSIFTHQLQPFEENQSPSPIEEHGNPFDLYNTRSRSPPRAAPSSSPPAASPPKLSPINTLQRQLSGDPESPPPAWVRRPSFSQSATQIKRSSTQYTSASVPVSPITGRPMRSPSDGGYSRTAHLPSRRHPGLMMTSSNPPVGLFLHDSPETSSTSLGDPAADLGLPQPAFRRRPGSGVSSNRSSVHSNLDGLNSEDLWNLEHDVTPDMSNPNRKAAERPLDTVRRMSRLTEARPNWNSGLPGDVIWPTAPPVTEIILPPVKSKSFTNVATLNRKASNTKLGRKVSKRQPSIDGLTMSKTPVYSMPKTDPNTPVIGRAESMISSADSSETSLTNPSPMPKTGLGSRPPSAYYSRDFLSSLAPREGGYAIAAMMGNGLGAVGTMSVDEKRRSGEEHRSRPASRAPMARSAGMGRWSLDGGEHYHSRPQSTTSSSFTGHAGSPEPSPQSEDSRSPSFSSYLPEGASPPATTSAAGSVAPSVLQRLDVSPPPMGVSSSSPINPSPLSRSLSQTLTKSPPPATAATIPVPPIPTSPPRALSPQKSKKDLAKEAKAAEKAEAAKLAKERADKARAEAMRTIKEKQAAEKAAADKKAADKASAAKAEAERKAKYAQMKIEAKRKEKEEKEKKKADKETAKRQAKAAAAASAAAAAATPSPVTSAAPSAAPSKKSGLLGMTAPSLTSLPSVVTFSRRASTVGAGASATTSTSAIAPAPPAPVVPVELGGAPVSASTVPPAASETASAPAPRKPTVSASLVKMVPTDSPSAVPPPDSTGGKKKFGLLGTIKKRFSIMDASTSASSSRSSGPSGARRGDSPSSPAGPTPPPKSPVTPKAGNSGSSADTAMPPTPTPKASLLSSAPIMAAQREEERVVIIPAPPSESPAPVPEEWGTPSSFAIAQSSNLSPPQPTASRPPRSSSYAASPASVRSAVVPTPDEIPGPSTVSPASSVRRSNRGSVHGPRPMPPRRRSHSAASRSSGAPSGAPASPPLGTSGSPGQSFPFHVPPTLGDSNSAALSYTTTTQSQSSGQASDLASPFASEGSRKSSMTSADVDADAEAASLAAAYLAKPDSVPTSPAREGSNDTLKAKGLAPAVGAIVAAH